MFIRNYKFHFFLIILVSSLILGLDIGLTSLYKYYRYNKSQKRKSIRIKHPVYHHTFKPMISIDDFYGPMKYQLITNSLGFKDKIRRNVKKKISKKRILFIGDSFTEGVGLKYEDTFVGLVHSKINKDFDVLNAGRSSYCPYLSFLKIKDLVAEKNYVINEIFVFIDVSDAQDELFRYFKLKVKNNLIPDTTRYNQNKYRNYLNNSLIALEDKLKDISMDSSNKSIDLSIYRLKRILEKKTTIIYPVLNYIYDRYLFGENNKVINTKYQKVIDYYKEINKKSPYQGDFYHVASIPYYRDGEVWTTDSTLYEEWGKQGLDESMKYMDSIKVFCDSRKIKMNIGIYPYANELLFMPSQSYHEKYWIEYADQNNISLFNIYDDFRQRLKGKEKKIFIKENYIVNDVHFNFAGNVKIADYIIKTLDY